MPAARLAAGVLLALAALPLASLPLAAQERSSGPQGDGPRRTPARAYADPSSVIAAEIAFARLAREKGQWTAFRATAAPEAEMFVPARVNALAWLKDRADPPETVRWQTHSVWMSCDGASAVTRGAWQRSGSTGWFTTIWQRQPRKGEWKWVMDQGDTLDAALPEPDMLSASVADCSTGRPARAVERAPGEEHDFKAGSSSDRSLSWTTQVFPDGARQLRVRLWKAGTWETVIAADFAAPPPPVVPPIVPSEPGGA